MCIFDHPLVVLARTFTPILQVSRYRDVNAREAESMILSGMGIQLYHGKS